MNEISLGGNAGESIFLERIIYEGRPVKRHSVRSRVSNEDTRSSGIRCREDEV
jgi:hypothetical protein